MHVNIKVNCYLRVKKMTACIERTLRKLAEKYFCIFVNLMCLFVIFRTKQNNFNTSYLHEQHETSGHILEFFFTHTHMCASMRAHTQTHVPTQQHIYIHIYVYIYMCVYMYMFIYVYIYICSIIFSQFVYMQQFLL